MKSQNLHALIVGGGFAGSALALLLKEAGMSSAVYEAHQSLEDVGGCVAVTARPGGAVGIPVKVNIDSGGKPNGVPERR